MITKVNEQNRIEINKGIIKNFRYLVMDANGICVLKKFIAENKSDFIKQLVFEEVKKHYIDIIRDPYGNYIIQFIIDVRIKLIFKVFKFLNVLKCLIKKGMASRN